MKSGRKGKIHLIAANAESCWNLDVLFALVFRAALGLNGGDAVTWRIEEQECNEYDY